MLNVLDLFAGIGGFSLGLERTGGFRTVAFCEADPTAARVLNKHWPDVPVFPDVRTLTKEQLNDRIDVITGGFPCQDISLAGAGAGLDGARSSLWFEFRRLIAEIRPQWAIIENVSVLRSRGLDRVLRSLSEIGYDAEWHCIPASAVGAPHRRDRIWIVAHPAGVGWGEECKDGGGCCKGSGTEGDQWCRSLFGCPALADANRQRGCSRDPERKDAANVGEPSRCMRLYAGGMGTWDAEPNVGRVAHGVPGRVDRLKQLGNAVVPMIPQLLGQAILDYSTRRSVRPSI